MTKSVILFLAFSLPMLAAWPETEVRRMLDDQAAAWNRGDIKAYMLGYEDSSDTVFVNSFITHGPRAVLDRYLYSYPTTGSMGFLTFSEVEIHVLGVEYASVVGRYRLERSRDYGGDYFGVFTLLLRRKPDGWRIVVDHSSPAEPPRR